VSTPLNPVQNRSNPPGPIVVHLIYSDVEAATDWLCRVFGFTERLRAGNPAGHAQLLTPLGGSIVLGRARTGQSPDWGDTAEFRPPDPAVVSQVVTVAVGDVDAHHAHVESHGARIFGSPQDYPFGERQYTAVDLEGHRWTFSQTIADIAPATWGARLPSP